MISTRRRKNATGMVECQVKYLKTADGLANHDARTRQAFRDPGFSGANVLQTRRLINLSAKNVISEQC